MNLDKLILLATLYSGGALLALVIIAIGWRAAHRKGAVIAVALAAGICLVLQAIVLWALSDIGGGWGGDRVDLPTAVGGLATIIGFAALAFFVPLKLREPLPGHAGRRAGLRTASVLLVVWVALFLANSLRYSPVALLLGNARFLAVVAGGLVAAWGLWRGERWGSWLALAVGTWEVARFLLWIPTSPFGVAGGILSLRGIGILAMTGAMILLLRNPPWRADGNGIEP